MTFEANEFRADTDPVPVALAHLREGRMVLVVDDEDRENEGDLIMAAEMATTEAMAFAIRHTTGLVCVAMTDERADELQLPLMVPDNDDPHRTAFTVSVDLKDATTTGVSASDRALTIRALAESSTLPHQLSRPGHVFPLRARPGGVLERAGHTESAVDLCRLAGLAPIGVLAEVINDDGTMARRPQLETLARERGLLMVTVADIVRHRARQEGQVHRQARCRIPTRHGDFTAVGFRTLTGELEHVALVLGDVDQRNAQMELRDAAPILARVHAECFLGDALGSLQCDCAAKLDQSMAIIGAAGRGAVVYLRHSAGAQIPTQTNRTCCAGSRNKAVDSDATERLMDHRELSSAASILGALGVRTVRLMTDNPDNCAGLRDLGVDVISSQPSATPGGSAADTHRTAKGQTDPVVGRLLVS